MVCRRRHLLRKYRVVLVHLTIGTKLTNCLLSSGPRGWCRVVGVGKRSLHGSRCLYSSLLWLAAETQDAGIIHTLRNSIVQAGRQAEQSSDKVRSPAWIITAMYIIAYRYV